MTWMFGILIQSPNIRLVIDVYLHKQEGEILDMKKKIDKKLPSMSLARPTLGALSKEIQPNQEVTSEEK